ncbi:GTPase-activating 24-like isoform X2 [Octopus vulgaris]|nr:GTPase-activating 24-like isoform X2 [Octopus vulgaris]
MMNSHPISKKGWLRKLGGIVKTWQRRWIVLNGNILFYFTREDDQKSLGSILLPGNRAFAHSYSPGNPDKYIFEIEPDKNMKASNPTPHEVSLFCCESEAERQEWIRAIRKVIYGPNGGAIFGQYLKETMLYEHNNKTKRKVPYIIEACVKFLEEHGLETEGVYRLAGRVVLIKELQESFDTGERIRLEDGEADVHTVASLLKLYLRELPDSIIPSEHFQRFMSIAYEAVDKHKNQDEEFIPRLTEAVNILESDNYNILQYLCKHLHKVSQYSDVNKMTLANLAMVFGPNVIRHEDENPEILRATADLNQKLALILIKHSDVIFAHDCGPNLLDMPLALPCDAPLLQPLTNTCEPPLQTSDIEFQLADEFNNLPVTSPSPFTKSRSLKALKPAPPLRLTKTNSSRHHRRLRLVEKNNNFNDSLSSPDSCKSPETPPASFGGNTEGFGEVASPSEVKFKWEHFTSSNAVFDTSDIKHIPKEDKEEMSKPVTEVEKLKKDLNRMKILYEEKVVEVESLKVQLQNQSNAKDKTIDKVIELQEILNKYKIRYGELK